MDLTLAEQTLLIALDDEKGRDTTDWGSDPGLAAALLLDLARLERVEVDGNGKLVASPGAAAGAIGDELLDDALAVIRSDDKRRDVKAWVGRLPGKLKPLRTRVSQRLVERGVLSQERSKFLGLVPTTRFPTADPVPERELRSRLEAVLVAGAEPSPEEALLIGLLEPLGLIDPVVAKPDRRGARKRAREVADQGLAGNAVRDAVREVQMAVMVAVIVPTVVTTTS